MSRNEQFFPLRNIDEFAGKAHCWCDQFSHFCSLNPSEQDYLYGTFPKIIAADAEILVTSTSGNNFQKLEDYLAKNKTWLFGHMSYDLKNETENLSSIHPDRIDFPDMTFFRPKHIFHFSAKGVTLETDGSPSELFEEILNFKVPDPDPVPQVKLTCDTSKKSYIDTIQKLRNHIEEGDIYEINYCMNYFAENVSLSATSLFNHLAKLSPSPFSALYKVGNRYALCASPERFLKKQKSKVISQPIKGTASRGVTEKLDKKSREELKKSEKERAENMMIVDLVRNDLARSSAPGSVKVEEMFGIYTFPQLHQMMSTVTGQLPPAKSPVEVIKNAFPMGSMTGAPKIKVMELIEKYERSRRGLFSGSIGYFTPQNDFDFNVMIRSLFYDNSLKKISFSVGSAITYDSDPVREYQECLLKASAIIQLLQAEK